jgi:putative methyltransferase (TIGR04325 family)
VSRIGIAAKQLTPPLLWNSLKRAKGRFRPGREPDSEAHVEQEPPEWEYVPEGWARPAKGWDTEAIVAAYRERWPSYVAALAAPRPLGVYHEVVAGESVEENDREAHNMLVSFAYVLARVARGRNRISMLDWGGGLGHYLALSRAVLPDLQVEYHCRELPAVAAAGRDLFPEAFFYSDDSCLVRRYDLVLASSSLQYSETWQETLQDLAAATHSYLYATRVPLALRVPSFVVLQRAYRYGYETEYLGWVLNRGELLEQAEFAGLSLLREFLLFGQIDAEGAPERPVEHRGFLFARN